MFISYTYITQYTLQTVTTDKNCLTFEGEKDILYKALKMISLSDQYILCSETWNNIQITKPERNLMFTTCLIECFVF
jgi:hypothetical protein